MRLTNGKSKRSLRTANLREAEAIQGTVETTLIAIERGWLVVPEGVDLDEFLISGGKAGSKPTIPHTVTLSELFEKHFACIPTENFGG